MSPNVTHATRCHATAKKTDLEVFEPMMWEKEARHIGGQKIKNSKLIQCINMHFGPYIYSVSH